MYNNIGSVYCKVRIRYSCLHITSQAGINVHQDKELSIKSSWEAIESSRKHQRFPDAPVGLFMSIDRKCWIGMCLQPPI